MDKIESYLMAIYKDIQKQVPKLHDLSFDVTTYDGGDSKLHGFIHVGKGCASFNSISELNTIVRNEKCISKNEILYRNFKGVL